MTQQSTAWAEGIPRMVALAERFASEGHMNLNKLIEAAVYAQTRRAAWRYRPLVTKESMPAELDASLKFLNREGADQELVRSLEKGLQGLIEAESSVILFADAPDVYVCRTCGHVAMRAIPERCPDCGSWPGRFRKFTATFNMDNMEPLNPVEVISLFAQNAVDLVGLVEGLSEDQLSQKPAENEWSIREHVAHFYDAQEMLDTRLELMLNQDNPELAAMAIYEDAGEEEGRPETTAGLLSEFLNLRARSITLLESLPLKDLWRTGRHTEFGRITVLRQVAYLAYHEQTHLPEMEALREGLVS
jgi:rubrerythrin